MPITTVSWGDSVVPASQPHFVFPIVSNQVEEAVYLTSTIAGTVIDTEGTGVLAATDIESGTPSDLTAIIAPGGTQGVVKNIPIAGQLANLAVQVSINGAAFAVGTGVLSEISAGYYKYIPAATETQTPGPVTVRVHPITPIVATNIYIEETCLTFTVVKPGFPIVNVNPNSPGLMEALNTGPNSPVTNLENFIRQALRDLLGNQMTNKPTFTKN